MDFREAGNRSRRFGLYITGSCGYGAKCRYIHPPDRSSVGAVQLGGSEHPERVEEPTCQYYLRTGPVNIVHHASSTIQETWVDPQTIYH
ncbi:zinc finger CCCH domain-containing protein 32-like isoform X2 [Lycium barbarum]|nr:zinc finger CCCH domain-containing protein 32-like isoform X2 [Lycium barbarum]